MPVDRLTKPLARFVQIETAGGGALLLATFTALLLSNSPWAEAFARIWETPAGLHIGSLDFARSLKEWINDAAMTLFFFLVALELKRELVLGELRDPRVAALSIAGALGGMTVPALLYLALQWQQPGERAWGVVMATDTAFVIGCLALLGSRIPHSLRVFMLSLAIVDDVGAILVVAIGYSGPIVWSALGLAVLGFAGVRLMGRIGIRGFAQYFLIGGLIWLAMDASGIHATITGVILGLMTPARRWVSDDRLYAILDKVVAHPAGEASSEDTKDRSTLQLAEIASRETLSPVERLEIGLHTWVVFIVMPLFALANAGMPLPVTGFVPGLTLAVFLGFVIGKPLGILLFTWLALASGLATRADDLSWRLLAGGGLLAGIGFTMALFITQLALGDALIGSAKLGILLASIASGLAGLAVLAGASRQAAP
ncbi:sodium/proton antiporter, NhaA family [Solimonas aquatica]|uniref:Na(+)/H(+) antiporter NhaA n=1 Tax=Solimonas aquatica TaxID=489703 RepID=A0A1H9KER7_9GAMM|nr:Na+/H+ antiporter NhaA [Solimonas aquatica]SEQ97611.1 sodium/proton antiporter, NhaA family [Solimonas aquatica]